MAVARLHNVSAFSPSFFGETRSQVSRSWDDQRERPSTRASSLLQMWRELEGVEHVVSHSHRSRQLRSNCSDSECVSTSTSIGQGSENGDDISEYVDEFQNRETTGLETEHEDNNSVISEQSSDLGDVERERVRQIFREWMNNGAKSHSPSGFHRNKQSEPQCLGENECGRVRIIREWARTNIEQSSSCGSPSDGVAEVGSQIEQVREGLVINPEIGARRSIRRLCGRQTLLDLLFRAQYERQRELQGLSEQKPVSDFAHRNRIQALLRGRFLRNERSIPDERPSSNAASELGLLRQRHTVSDLREGFLCKLDNSAYTSANSDESDSSTTDGKNGQSESLCRERNVTTNDSTLNLENTADRNRSPQNSAEQVTNIEEPVLNNERSMLELIIDVESAGSIEEPVLESENGLQEVSFDVECVGGRYVELENTIITDDWLRQTEDIYDSGPPEVFHERSEGRSEVSDVHESTINTDNFDENPNEESDLQDASAQLEEFQDSVIEIEDRAWQLANGAFIDWAVDSRDDIARNWQETSADQWFQEISGNDAVEGDQMQESNENWAGHDLHEAIDSWLDMPSVDVDASIGRLDAFYFPSEDNVYSMELRELHSRRRVSGLLRSSFRESLDQVLQSHVERLGHASNDWELDNISSSPLLIEEEQEQQNGDQILDGVLHGGNWPHNSTNQNLRIEWEVINELRMGMAKLQQRINNMQSMLEACMDMQIELQRSVRQEVSATLNQSFFSKVSSTDASERNLFHDETRWGYMKKGICCICCDSNIDSLLYRCGHMCTCSSCAENLVQDMGKCPMCQAPIVEVVRAYFIQ